MSLISSSFFRILAKSCTIASDKSSNRFNSTSTGFNLAASPICQWKLIMMLIFISESSNTFDENLSGLVSIAWYNQYKSITKNATTIELKLSNKYYNNFSACMCFAQSTEKKISGNVVYNVCSRANFWAIKCNKITNYVKCFLS